MEQKRLTRDDFAAICGELLIDIGIALESDTVCEALKEGCTAAQLRQVLIDEF